MVRVGEWERTEAECVVWKVYADVASVHRRRVTRRKRRVAQLLGERMRAQDAVETPVAC